MSRKAGAYRAWSRLYSTGLRACDGVTTGLWLGLLDRPDLHAVDQAEYEARSVYRTDEHNLGGPFGWEQRSLSRHFPATGRLVVLGAGGGREVLMLADLGYEAVGFECNPVLVSAGRDLLARQGRAGAQLHHLGRDQAPTSGGPYAGAVVGWSVYTLIAGRRQRVSFLSGLRRCLSPGAPVLLSFFTRAAGERRAGLVTSVANPVRRLRRREPVQAGDDLAPNFVHRFTEAELAGELSDGGYQLVVFNPERRVAGEPGHAVARVR